MRQIEIKERLAIDADPETVWAAIKDPAAHAAWHPFLTEIKGAHELAAERACSVKLSGRASRTRERCVVEEPLQRMTWRIDDDSSDFSRMVSGWTAGFSLVPQNSGTLVTAESAFRPRNLLARLMMPLVRRKFHQTQKAILQGLSDASTEPDGTTAGKR